MTIKLTDKQIQILKFYNVNTNVKNLKELLENIYEEEYCFLDEKGLPANEHYYILEDLYCDIKSQNK